MGVSSIREIRCFSLGSSCSSYDLIYLTGTRGGNPVDSPHGQSLELSVATEKMASIVDSVSFSSHGVVPVVTQDYDTGEVLSFGYMDSESLERSADSRRVHLLGSHHDAPASNKEGCVSEPVQFIKKIRLHKDSRSLLIQVTRFLPANTPRPYSAYHCRWCPQSHSWVEEGEGGFVPPAAVSD